MLAPTPRDVLHREGSARLYRFRPPPDAADAAVGERPVVLLVPSLINRWYVLDLRRGASVVEALVGARCDVFLLDWGVPGDEDRYLTWEDVLRRLARAVRKVRCEVGRPPGVLGYCMGATLAGIHAALEPESISAFVNLLGPFDFSKAGFLGHLADARWFDPEAVAEAGNVHPLQMQSAFVMLRPTTQVSKWVGLFERMFDPAFRDAFEALETWANDNVPFPAAAYETYIRELYQKNALVRGAHFVAGRRVELSRIRCPVLTVTADRDAICPPEAAEALNAACGSPKAMSLTIPGGHVGAVVGARAASTLYPALADFFLRGTKCNSIN